ncbi:MAG: MMPL family transporter [Pirellulales bacterium]
MTARFSAWISRHWLLTIVVWIVVLVLVRQTTPRWDDVTNDGDLAYMPADMPSVRGERLLEEAFPGGRAKSDMVVVMSRRDGPIREEDLPSLNAVAERMFNLLGVAAMQRAELSRQEITAAETRSEPTVAQTARQRMAQQLQQAEEAFDQALEINEKSAWVLHNRGILFRRLGRVDDGKFEQQLARELEPSLAEHPDQIFPDSKALTPVLDVWTHHTPHVGSKLISRDESARLVILRLSTEFMAAENIELLETIQRQLDIVRSEIPAGMELGISGSASIGADMLSSARDSIKNTELYTILLVVGFLALVYRSPLLVLIPLATIGVALAVSTGMVAALTQLNQLPGFEFWNYKIFTTTKIFVVVILFGAGTDFCLFLISRYREELDHGLPPAQALTSALAGVSGALWGSAMTTILGLGTMFFAEFGKFRNSGPTIALCLAVTLIACLTFSPALLRAMGKSVFWPIGLRRDRLRRTGVGQDDTSGQPAVAGRAEVESTADGGDHSPLWHAIAVGILRHPGLILGVSIVAMLPFAWRGLSVTTTYDLLSELSPTRPSRVGTALVRAHYPIGESGPLVVLIRKPQANLDGKEGGRGLFALTEQLYVPGVQAVRSLAEPLGDKPDRKLSPLSSAGRMKAAMRAHERLRALYLAKGAAVDGGDIARLELVLANDPFSIEATETLERVEAVLKQLVSGPDQYWSGAEYAFAGTTAAIRDLRQVTGSDNVRIQILVVLAVLAILLVLLQRPVVCLYMIASVLFSYYVSIGASEMFFHYLYGPTYQGLDWKVPLFLFVILVAIGQDYNIYLATRVFEEQERYGLMPGLRRAIERTGGIITSCGVIMAGTFIAMMSGSLRGIVELGFALTLGVLLDTFVVRTILLPAFLALLFRRHEQKESREPGGSSMRPPRSARSGSNVISAT